MVQKTLNKSNTYHHGNLAEACILQGIEFLKAGNNNFSLRDVARSIGVSHGAPSRHFGSKEGLMAAIAEEGFRQFNEYLKASNVKGDPKASFFAMGRAYLKFALDHPHHYRMMLGDKISDHGNYPQLDYQAKTAFDQLVELVEQLQSKQFFKSGEPREQAYCIWSGVHGLVSLTIEGHFQEDAFKVVDEMNQSFFKGFSLALTSS